MQSSELSLKQSQQVAWWKRFLGGRVNFPQAGNFFIVPDGERDGCGAHLVHETGRKINFTLDDGETWGESLAMFAAVLPNGIIALATCLPPSVAPRSIKECQTCGGSGLIDVVPGQIRRCDVCRPVLNK